MSIILGYSDVLKTARQQIEIKRGVVADSNALIAATYESDPVHDRTAELFDLLSEFEIPVFCNVNSRAEFLEIHRRIIFTEALVDFAQTADKAKLPVELAKQLHSLVTRSGTAKSRRSSGLPMRLSEPEIKSFKLRMLKISSRDTNLWSQLCLEKVGNKIGHVWDRAVDELGLNFLSLRREDADPYLVHSLEWNGVVKLMEHYGLSSADAMIVNLFLASSFIALVTSDIEVAVTLADIPNHNKVCFLPDSLVKGRLSDL